MDVSSSRVRRKGMTIPGKAAGRDPESIQSLALGFQLPLE
jgi:hypothetical protein